jgi:hypothetical protein
MSSIYSPLELARREFRIAHLQPGKWTDEINCKLEVVSLDNPPGYETLSYVWGDPTRTTEYVT